MSRVPLPRRSRESRAGKALQATKLLQAGSVRQALQVRAALLSKRLYLGLEAVTVGLVLERRVCPILRGLFPPVAFGGGSLQLRKRGIGLSQTCSVAPTPGYSKGAAHLGGEVGGGHVHEYDAHAMRARAARHHTMMSHHTT
jgi:hypothetical protein